MIKRIFVLLIWLACHFSLVQASSSPFLDAMTCTPSETKGNAVFTTINKSTVEAPYLLVADSAYDQTFKKIFSWDNTVDGVTGAERTMSILNSIFYPDATPDGFMIRDIKPLPNESTRFDEKTPLGMLKFDVACRCSCWANGHPHEVKIFDVEMQTAYEPGFAGRLFDYGSTLRIANEHQHVIILAFLNYVRNEPDSSSWLGLFHRDLSTGAPTQAVEGVVDTHCVDLSKKAHLLATNTPIVIGGKTIGTVGREWLKLLSMRHWATKTAGSRYVVPKEGASDRTVNSALTILASVSEPDLQNYIQQESSAFAMLRGAKNDGFHEGMQAGMQAGALEQAKKTAVALIGMGMDNEHIQQATGLSLEQIEALRTAG